MFNTRMQDCFLLVHVDRVATGQEMVRGKNYASRPGNYILRQGKFIF